MTTTHPAPAGTICPPSDVVNLIIPWADVAAGDLVLFDGEFCLVTHKADCAGRPLFWLEGSDAGNGGVLPAGTYAAVRRYVEG